MQPKPANFGSYKELEARRFFRRQGEVESLRALFLKDLLTHHRCLRFTSKLAHVSADLPHKEKHLPRKEIRGKPILNLDKLTTPRWCDRVGNCVGRCVPCAWSWRSGSSILVPDAASIKMRASSDSGWETNRS